MRPSLLLKLHERSVASVAWSGLRPLRPRNPSLGTLSPLQPRTPGSCPRTHSAQGFAQKHPNPRGGGRGPAAPASLAREPTPRGRQRAAPRSPPAALAPWSCRRGAGLVAPVCSLDQSREPSLYRPESLLHSHFHRTHLLDAHTNYRGDGGILPHFLDPRKHCSSRAACSQPTGLGRRSS